jgi:hypothetical protein
LKEETMRTHLAFGKAIVAALALAMATLALGTGSRAQDAAVAISVKNHHFQPAEVRAPANRRLAITVKNLDTTAMEFESVSLRVEKVIAAGSEGVVNIRPLTPGRYEFFDDFHQETRGVLVVQ